MFLDYKRLLDAITEPCFVHDAKFKVVYANKAYARAAKKSLKQILNKVYWQAFPNGKGPLEGCKQALVDKKTIVEAIKVKSKFYVSRSFPVYKNKEYLYSVHIFQDVSHEHKILNDLKEEKNNLSKIFEGAVDALFLLDKKGRFVKVNTAACKSLGYSKEQLLNVTVYDVEKAISRTIYQDIWQKAKNKKTISLNGRHMHKDGTEFPVEVHVSLIELENQDYLLAMVRNKSEHEHLINSLERRIKLEELAKNISTSLNESEDLKQFQEDLVITLGEALQASRCYIFRYHDNTDYISNCYEWCAPKVKSFKNLLKNINLKTDFPWVYKKLSKHQAVCINNVHKMPKAAAKFQQELLREDIVSTIFLPLIDHNQIYGFIGFDHNSNASFWQKGDIELLTTISHLLAGAITKQHQEDKKQEYHQRLETMWYKTIEAMIQMTEQRDPYTAGHQMRVAALAKAIAKKMQLSKDEIEGIYLAALIHDIGKIRVPVEILSSPIPLTTEEMKIIKIHPQVGYNIIEDIPFIWPIKQYIVQHHERLDGSGYPNGLKKKDILLGSRIIAVADTYEAMTGHRPYRPALNQKLALQELKENAGKLYDKNVVQACLEVVLKDKFVLPQPDIDTALFKP